MREYTEKEKNLLAQVLPDIAQELRAAMTNVYIAVERIAPNELRERHADLDRSAAVFTQNFYRVTRMLGSLNDAAELAESGLFPMLLNDDIIGIVRGVCEQSEAPFEGEGVTLTFKCDRLGCVIAVDAERVEHMLFHLLSNALKFTPKGGTVEVSVRVTEGSVFITVSDTGEGIAPARQAFVFDSYRHRDTARPAPCGMGFGLAVCRRIAEGHGGSIALESQPGRGTRVTVTLPRNKSNVVLLGQPRVVYGGGFNRTLLELSDALGSDAFTYRHLD